jgi:ABC-type dipeptide/oligopeptide/nickel transport system permease subunit
VTAVPAQARLRSVRGRLTLGRSWSGRVGLVLGLLILAIALAGPFVAPHSPSELVGPAYQRPTSSFPLGTDFLGRDVLSRVLWGGRSVIGLAVTATALAYVVGVSIGLLAGFSRTPVDPALMRAMDVLLAFPPIILLLVLATGAGPSAWALIVGVAITHVPGIARIVRAATLEASVRGYVEAAVARGERVRFILGREILPNIALPILADAGVRLTGSILLVASVNFLGLGLQPPSADWALMISENRQGLTIQPWAAVVPIILIAGLTIAVNLVADAFARGLGRSVERARIAR